MNCLLGPWGKSLHPVNPSNRGGTGNGLGAQVVRQCVPMAVIGKLEAISVLSVVLYEDRLHVDKRMPEGSRTHEEIVAHHGEVTRIDCMQSLVIVKLWPAPVDHKEDSRWIEP